MSLCHDTGLGTNVASLLWLHWSPVLLYTGIAKLQCKQTVVTDFCMSYVNKIHVIGKGMIKETWTAKIKEIRCWTEELLTYLSYSSRFFLMFKRASKFYDLEYRLKLRLWAWRNTRRSTRSCKQCQRSWHKTIFLIGKLNSGCSSPGCKIIEGIEGNCFGCPYQLPWCFRN